MLVSGPQSQVIINITITVILMIICIVYKVLKEREYYGNSTSISPLGPFSDSKIFSEKLCTKFLVENIIF